MYNLLIILLIILLFYKNIKNGKKYFINNIEHFIRGLPKRSSKFERNSKLKLTNWDPHFRGFEKKESKSDKLMKIYLNEISEPVSHNNKVFDSTVFFAKGQKNFSQDISLPMITSKYNMLKQNLNKLIDKKSNIKKVKKDEKLFLSKDNAIKIAKNFIIKYNNKYQNKITFIKILDLYKKRLINKKHVRYVISLFIKIPKYRHVFQILIVSEIPIKNEITFQNKYDDKHIVYILNNIIISNLLGSWNQSDIILGSNKNFEQKNFKYQIDFKGKNPYLLLKKDEIIKKLVKDKLYKNKNSRLSIYALKHKRPIKKSIKEKDKYHKYDFNEGLIKLGNKCIDKSLENNKWILNDCKKTKQIFEKRNNEYKIDDVNSLSFHKDNEFTFGTYRDKNICINSKNDITKNCKKLKFKKFGGIEIIGLNKCLNYNSDNTWNSIDCKNAQKGEFIKLNKNKVIKNKKKGKIQIGKLCLDQDLNKKDNWILKDCNSAGKFIHENNTFTQDGINCLTYHLPGKLGISPCDDKNYCKETNLSQNCKKFKFMKRNGMKIIGKNKCLNEKFKEIDCSNAPISKFII